MYTEFQIKGFTMNRTVTPLLLLFLLCLHITQCVEGAESKLVKTMADGRLVMQPWNEQGDRLPDFSFCGYRNGGVKLPDVPTSVTLEPSGAEDESERIQTALDDLGKSLEKTPDGRGALLLKKGLWKVNKTLNMSYSGVVLRGEGDGEDGTVLLATMKEGTLITVAHKDPGPADPTYAGLKDMLAQSYVPVGATRFKTTAANLKPGDEISIVRPGTQEWLAAIGMDAFPPATKACKWDAKTFNLVFVRKVLSFANGELVFDIPLPQSLDQRYGGAFVLPAPTVSRIRECGVESLRVDNVFDPTIVAKSGRGALTANVPVDEKHIAWAICIDNAEDVWLRNCTAINLFNGVAVFGKFSRRVTTQDCSALDPVSTLGGGRRYGFLLYRGSSQILVQRCFGRNNRHDYLTGSITPGPNAFVDCSAEWSWDGTENHQKWAMGTLFDGVRISGPNAGLFAANRGRWGGGHGWTGNTTVFWNCAANVIFANQPPLGQNFMIGNSDPKLFDPVKAKGWISALNNPSGRNDELCEGTLQGTAWKEFPSESVTPRSLYYAQLEARLGKAAVENVTTEEQRKRR
jgi:hypothetical protein